MTQTLEPRPDTDAMPTPRPSSVRPAGQLRSAAAEAVAPVMQPIRTARMIFEVAWKALLNVPAALKYRAQIVSLISDVSVGVGAFLLGAGALIVMIFMTGVIGVQLSLEGVKGLEIIGAEDLIGFISAFANVREIMPLAAAIIFAAQIGANFTAELGAMRISEEIDALDVMGIPALRYLVSTRLIASFITVLPLYVVGLYVGLVTTRLTSIQFFGISPGIYDQYFELYLPRIDIVYSVLKVLVFIVIITFVHCAYGFRVSGGPESVGYAVGRAVRLSVTTVFIVNFAMSLTFWGFADTVRFSG